MSREFQCPGGFPYPRGSHIPRGSRVPGVPSPRGFPFLGLTDTAVRVLYGIMCCMRTCAVWERVLYGNVCCMGTCAVWERWCPHGGAGAAEMKHQSDSDSDIKQCTEDLILQP